jgi:hypothetical protein
MALALQSARKLETGSTPAARAAGIQLAASVTIESVTATPANVFKSVACAWNKRLA